MSAGIPERGERLSFRQVGHAYGQQDVLRDLTVELTSGITALVGVNGAGKSTLLRIAAGAVEPSGGSVAINGDNPYGRGRRRTLAQVALMPQHTTFPGHLTALEVVTYLAWMRGLSGRAARRAALPALESVGLADRAKSKVSQLSGGMVRRLALAQALATTPGVLLLDEPSTGLDPQQRRIMVDLVAAVKGAVLLSSHVMEDVTDVADRVLVLHEGRIAFDGSVTELTGLAPAGVPEGRRAEAGFLTVLGAPIVPGAVQG